MGEHSVDFVVTEQGVKMDRLQHSLGKREGTVQNRTRTDYILAAPHTTKHHKTRCGAVKPTAFLKMEESAIFTDGCILADRAGAELGSTVASVDS